MKMDGSRYLIWKMVAANTVGPTIRLEVWNERSPEETRENYIDLTLASDNASFTYRMKKQEAEDLIKHLQQALDYSRQI